MNIVRQIYVRITEIALLLILLILPFSYKTINSQWTVFFSFLLGICVFIYLSKKIRPANYRIWRTIFALIFMLIFDMAEKVNIIRYIPLSTVLIVIAILVFMVKIIIEGKLKIISHPFAQYFFCACVFLLILMTVFYPFFFYHYQMQSDSNIQLFSRILKYAFLYIFVVNYLSDEKKFKKTLLGFIFSLSTTIILSILL